MEKVTVRNFRCFREEQTARLAPLTLLVGENSTGKTSFLALLRALRQLAFQEIAPDFREPPYDLGSFGDIVHNRGTGDAPSADSFEASFEYRWPAADDDILRFHAVFDERQGVPFPASRSIAGKDAWVKADIANDGSFVLKFGTPEKEWERHIESGFPVMRGKDELIGFFYIVLLSRSIKDGQPGQSESIPVNELEPVLDLVRPINWPVSFYAGAPVRTYPKRTYDPIRPSPDPQGEYIPTYLSNMSRYDAGKWGILKSGLERFGRQSGLFDEIRINSLGAAAGAPFQVHIGKYGKESESRTRNLIDVGYGVSQSLSLITELLDSEPQTLFLLQQPEIHLHPKAQAAVGTLFCEIAASGRQLMVETHSEYILDRIRMDVRDKTTDLKPEDVSILYFEPDNHGVTIHSIRIDLQGNILDAPDGYGQFFMDELLRSTGLQ